MELIFINFFVILLAILYDYTVLHRSASQPLYELRHTIMPQDNPQYAVAHFTRRIKKMFNHFSII